MHRKPIARTPFAGRPRRWALAPVFVGAVVVVALTLLVVSLAIAAAPDFSDVSANHPYHEAIADLATRGIIDGFPDGTFRPDDPVLRQQFAKMIVLSCGYPVSELDLCFFLDVEWSGLNGLYPDNYVAVAAKHGITLGKGPLSFAPYQDISRFQVITMVVRAADDIDPSLLVEPPAGYESTWDPAVSSDHGSNARRAEYNDLLAGLPLDQMDPWAAMPRGEVAQVLHNLLQRLDSGTTTTTTQPPVDLTDIAELKGLDWDGFLGQQVAVEGVFVRDPLPMLVTDLDVVRKDFAMPADSYVLLSGAAADAIDAAVYGGKTLRVTGQVAQCDVSGLVPTIDPSLGSAPPNLGLSGIEIQSEAGGTDVYCPLVATFPITYSSSPDPHKYAILFAGGIDPLQCHIRYWNDLRFMYSALVGPLDFPEENVTVLYGGGFGLDPRVPVNGPATNSNLSAAFQSLRDRTTEDDLIFVFFSNHGGGFWRDDPNANYQYGGAVDENQDEVGEALAESTYGVDINDDGDKSDTVAYDEELCAWSGLGGDGGVLDDELGTMMSDLRFRRLVTVTATCFGGGLIHDMTQGGERILMSSSGENEPSYSMSDGSYCIITYYFASAIKGTDPAGRPVDADTNGDGNVSMVEAFNYARAMNDKPNTYFYEDSGDGIPHSGAMPAQGEGALGASTWLGD